MPRSEASPQITVSFFEHRRRQRRFRMIIDLTTSIITKNPELSYREARCLVNCAERAIQELSPAYDQEFTSSERPKLEQLIQNRWPLEEFGECQAGETVN